MLKKETITSPLTYFLLAFVAMTGLSYINFLPGLVNALAGGIGFSEIQAGQIVALNGYGGLVGSTAAIFLVRRIPWRPAMFMFFATLLAFDLGSVFIDNYAVMLGSRFLAGVFGGLCIGIAFSLLARLYSPDRAFCVLLFVQFSIGSVVIYLFPILEAKFSSYAVFYVMASFVVLSLIFLPFLPSLCINKTASQHLEPASGISSQALLLLLAIAVYQIAASAIWAYVGLIGLAANIDANDVSTYIATTGLLGLLGAMLPVISGNRFGRLYWVIAGIAMSAIAALMLSFSQLTPLIYTTAMALLFFAWPAVQSYLLAVTAELDTTGRLSTIAAVVSSVGLASGPLLASALLDNDNYLVMLYTCAFIFVLSFFLQFIPVQAQKCRTIERQASQS